MVLPLMTKDPVTGSELLVTRLESPESGMVIEGRFSLGWMGRLTPEQLAFVGVMVKQRGNLQKMASEMNVAYNTIRNRMDDIVAALESPPAQKKNTTMSRVEILNRLSAGEISFDHAMQLLTRQIES